MTTLDNVLRQLREERDRARSVVDRFEKAISAIEGLGRSDGPRANGSRTKKTMSAAARRRIAQSQRARWAKLRSNTKPSATAKASPTKRTLSPEGRKRIAAAARARWARVKAQRTSKAA